MKPGIFLLENSKKHSVGEGTPSGEGDTNGVTTGSADPDSAGLWGPKITALIFFRCNFISHSNFCDFCVDVHCHK